MYLRGQGVTADAKKALEYHELAAKSGNPVALYNLVKVNLKILLKQKSFTSNLVN
ncbi:hypothetical protein CA943_03040 [Taylorella equigenitalis]|nr:hypothetical protein B9Z30_03105 [Taylorella equigenitalis]ASY37677.1 sel1 repeat family protein [Taylorella equigenitalis]ASY42099.1 hypothetical protein CA943_03040 [Taylorella equigenitalis]RBA26412.1 sel1 repeat family protein [Taylorella equigenitalis]WDU49957.1 hypothetical protein KNO34_03060 [Taylorella equigenitalis]